jgi:dienelactone hydrolase
VLRGREQPLLLYGPRGGPPVLLSSGDGGFRHLAPDVAEFLGARGFSVVGFDAKHYLSSFTSGSATLSTADVAADYRSLVAYARGSGAARVLLVGVSEGAGLSVVAAADPGLQPSLAGVLALGLPDVNELGWRFSDSVIYVTHKVPNEPTFRAADFLPRLGPVPLASVHATHDEFVPLPEAQRLATLPTGPHRLFVLDAADHRFSDKQPELQAALGEALAWIAAAPR